MEAVLAAAGAVALLLVVFLGVPYNLLVRYRNHCDEAAANVDTELKRRHDLIPNLVQTVKGYAAHERELLERVTALREQCRGEHGLGREREAHEKELVGTLDRLMIRLEAYPDLKASRAFLELQRELVNTEDRIQAALRFLNANVREYNNRVETFPSNLVASAFGFRTRPFFEVPCASIRAAPEVKL